MNKVYKNVSSFIIDQFGGDQSCSRALKIVGVEYSRITVWRWRQESPKYPTEWGSLPKDMLPDLIKAARACGFKLVTDLDHWNSQNSSETGSNFCSCGNLIPKPQSIRKHLKSNRRANLKNDQK